MALEWNGIFGGVLFSAFGRSVVLAVTPASLQRAVKAKTVDTDGAVIMRYYGHASTVLRIEVAQDSLVSVSEGHLLTHQIKTGITLIKLLPEDLCGSGTAKFVGMELIRVDDVMMAVVALTTGDVLAVDLQSGKPVWRGSAPKVCCISSTHTGEAHHTVYTGATDGMVCAWSPTHIVEVSGKKSMATKLSDMLTPAGEQDDQAGPDAAAATDSGPSDSDAVVHVKAEAVLHPSPADWTASVGAEVTAMFTARVGPTTGTTSASPSDPVMLIVGTTNGSVIGFDGREDSEDHLSARKATWRSTDDKSHHGAVTCIDYIHSTTMSMAFTGSSDRTLKAWKYEAGDSEHMLQPEWTSGAMGLDVTCLGVDAVHRHVYSGSYFTEHPFMCWDAVTGECVWGGTGGHTSSLLELWVDHESKQVFSGGGDGSVFAWPLGTTAAPTATAVDADASAPGAGAKAGGDGESAASAEAKPESTAAKLKLPWTVSYTGVCHRKGDNVLLAKYSGSVTYLADGTFNGLYCKLDPKSGATNTESELPGTWNPETGEWIDKTGSWKGSIDLTTKVVTLANAWGNPIVWTPNINRLTPGQPFTLDYTGVCHRKNDNALLARYAGTLTYTWDGKVNGKYKRLDAAGTSVVSESELPATWDPKTGDWIDATGSWKGKLDFGTLVISMANAWGNPIVWTPDSLDSLDNAAAVKPETLLKPLWSASTHVSDVNCATIDFLSDHVFIGTVEGELLQFKSAIGTPPEVSIQAHKSRIFSLEVVVREGKDTLLLSGGKDYRLLAWDVSSLTNDSKPVWTFNNGGSLTSTVNSCAVMRDQGLVFVGTLNDGFFCLDLDTGAKKWVQGGGVQRMAVNTDASLLYSAFTNYNSYGTIACRSVDGTVLWNRRAPLGPPSAPTAQQTAMALTYCPFANVVFTGTETRIMSFDGSTGAQAWATATVSRPVITLATSSGLLFAQNADVVDIYYTEGMEHVFRVDLDSSALMSLQVTAPAPGCSKSCSHKLNHFEHRLPHWLYVVGTQGERIRWSVEDRLGWAAVEVLESSVVVRSNLDVKLAEWTNWGEFITGFSILVIDFLQMLAFAGKGQPTTPALKSTQDSLNSLQSFGVESVTYTVVFIGVITVLCLFVLAFAVQEKVEEKRFLDPNSTLWKVAWLAMSTGTKLIAVSALLPMLKVLVEAWDCDFSGGGDGIWTAQPTTTCFAGDHVPYMIVSLVALVLYLPLSFRFLRVRGVLSGIELKRNPFDWSGDAVIKSGAKHALALRSNKYWLMSMLVKCVLTVFGVLLTSQLVAVSAMQVVVGVFLFYWGSKYPPYFLLGANNARSTLDLGAAWVFTCGFVASVWQQDKDTSGSTRNTVLTCMAALVVPIMLAHAFRARIAAVSKALCSKAVTRARPARLTKEEAGVTDRKAASGSDDGKSDGTAATAEGKAESKADD